MKKYIYIAPSTDPISDFEEIIEYAKNLQDIADFLHCDVMDGQFVQKSNFKYSLIKSIHANSLIPLDVHLMVNEPFEELEHYFLTGANILTLHYEAFENKNKLYEAINRIKEHKTLAGISLKPETTIKEAKNFLYLVDVVLLMAVKPGQSGQSFLTSTYAKLEELAKFREENNLKFKIEVDGGITPDISKKLISLGADMIVSGNYIFKHNNKAKAIEELRG